MEDNLRELTGYDSHEDKLSAQYNGGNWNLPPGYEPEDYEDK